MFATQRRIIILFSVFIFGVVYSKPSYAIDPRVKSLGIMAAYGTIGGALLGTASLAFGSSGRSVAKGASLGLYAGIVFGTFIVASHAYKRRKLTNPDPVPYEEEPGYGDKEQSGGGIFDGFNWGGGFGGGDEEDEAGGDDEGYGDPQRWNPYFEMNNLRFSAETARESQLRPSKTPAVYYINLVNFQF
jgi:hypothetical protein